MAPRIMYRHHSQTWIDPSAMQVLKEIHSILLGDEFEVPAANDEGPATPPASSAQQNGTRRRAA